MQHSHRTEDLCSHIGNHAGQRVCSDRRWIPAFETSLHQISRTDQVLAKGLGWTLSASVAGRRSRTGRLAGRSTGLCRRSRTGRLASGSAVLGRRSRTGRLASGSTGLGRRSRTGRLASGSTGLGRRSTGLRRGSTAAGLAARSAVLGSRSGALRRSRIAALILREQAHAGHPQLRQAELRQTNLRQTQAALAAARTGLTARALVGVTRWCLVTCLRCRSGTRRTLRLRHRTLVVEQTSLGRRDAHADHGHGDERGDPLHFPCSPRYKTPLTFLRERLRETPAGTPRPSFRAFAGPHRDNNPHAGSFFGRWPIALRPIPAVSRLMPTGDRRSQRSRRTGRSCRIWRT